jgi:hypothetical protein
MPLCPVFLVTLNDLNIFYAVCSAECFCYLKIEFAAFSEQSSLAASGWSGRVLNVPNGDDGDGRGAEELKGFMLV